MPSLRGFCAQFVVDEVILTGLERATQVVIGLLLVPMDAPGLQLPTPPPPPPNSFTNSIDSRGDTSRP